MTKQQILDFLGAGKAVFTLKSLRTGAHYTFKIEAPKRLSGTPPLFAKVLAGDEVWKYLGIFARSGKLIRTCKSPGRDGFDAPAFAALDWFLRNVESPRVEFKHAGRCGRCGRVLTHPDSIDSGLGPECSGRATGLTRGQRAALQSEGPGLTRQLQRSLAAEYADRVGRAQAGEVYAHPEHVGVPVEQIDCSAAIDHAKKQS